MSSSRSNKCTQWQDGGLESKLRSTPVVRAQTPHGAMRAEQWQSAGKHVMSATKRRQVNTTQTYYFCEGSKQHRCFN